MHIFHFGYVNQVWISHILCVKSFFCQTICIFSHFIINSRTIITRPQGLSLKFDPVVAKHNMGLHFRQLQILYWKWNVPASAQSQHKWKALWNKSWLPTWLGSLKVSWDQISSPWEIFLLKELVFGWKKKNLLNRGLWKN